MEFDKITEKLLMEQLQYRAPTAQYTGNPAMSARPVSASNDVRTNVVQQRQVAPTSVQQSPQPTYTSPNQQQQPAAQGNWSDRNLPTFKKFYNSKPSNILKGVANMIGKGVKGVATAPWTIDRLAGKAADKINNFAAGNRKPDTLPNSREASGGEGNTPDLSKYNINNFNNLAANGRLNFNSPAGTIKVKNILKLNGDEVTLRSNDYKTYNVNRDDLEIQ